MRLRLLGPLELLDADGGRVPVSGLKRRALLATLAVCAGRTVPLPRLTAELWGDRRPANAANALQAHVTRLRRAVETASGDTDRIVTGPAGYTLALRHGETDVAEFRTALTAARARPPAAAIPALRAALALWRGPALDGCGSGAVCAAEAAALDEARLGALELLYDASLRAGRHAEVIAELERDVAAHPLRERFCAQLMDALCRADRRADALAVYTAATRRLRTELGVDPGPALRARAAAV